MTYDAAVTERKGLENNETEDRYSLDLDWYENTERSFAAVAASRMCEQHRPRRTQTFNDDDPPSEKAVAQDTTSVLTTIQECCSEKIDYVTPYTPIAESVFRLFLTNTDKQFTIEEICALLAEKTGNSIVSARVIPSTIGRLIERGNHHHYVKHAPVSANDDEAEETETEPKAETAEDALVQE